MSITIRPDPERPSGGYALLELPEAELAGESALIAVFDAFSERFLGESGWHATRADFGPYPVTRAGGLARIVIGPEIVNQIEEYAALRLHVGPRSYETTWPDDVVPRPGAAVLGGLHVPRAAGPAPSDNLVGRPAVPEPEAPPADTPPPVAEPTGRGKGLLLAAGLALLALIAGAAWVLTRPDPEPAPAPAPVAAAPAPCSAQTLDALAGQPFASVLPQISTCGARIGADRVLNLLEDAAAKGDAAALMLFGQLYDPKAQNPLAAVPGLALSPNPALAAGYYKRALAAGNGAAEAPLGAVCAGLAAAGDTLSQAAHEEHCPK